MLTETYADILINMLWFFTPGANTPMQYFLTNQLHASNAVCADFSALYYAGFLPTVLLDGFLCTRLPARRLLWLSMIVGVPQFIPMAFIHTGNQALVAAVFIGLLGGLGNAAVIDIAIRACPPGLQGTLMMIVMSLYPFSSRVGDAFGSWLFVSAPRMDFSIAWSPSPSPTQSFCRSSRFSQNNCSPPPTENPTP